jgi:hypothetical protein
VPRPGPRRSSWLADRDEPGSWKADYEILANVFVCRFDADGRCREYTEYYMRRRPDPSRP